MIILFCLLFCFLLVGCGATPPSGDSNDTNMVDISGLSGNKVEENFDYFALDDGEIQKFISKGSGLQNMEYEPNDLVKMESSISLNIQGNRTQSFLGKISRANSRSKCL